VNERSDNCHFQRPHFHLTPPPQQRRFVQQCPHGRARYKPTDVSTSQRGWVGRHLAIRNKMCVSGSTTATRCCSGNQRRSRGPDPPELPSGVHAIKIRWDFFVEVEGEGSRQPLMMNSPGPLWTFKPVYAAGFSFLQKTCMQLLNGIENFSRELKLVRILSAVLTLVWIFNLGDHRARHGKVKRTSNGL